MADKYMPLEFGAKAGLSELIDDGDIVPLDNVDHPEHYNTGKYECIDVMIDIFGIEAVINFCELNAFKYLWRSRNKNGEEDLNKAIWYLNKRKELSHE